MRMRVIEHPGPRLEAMSNPGECWLWCDECKRFFQYKRAKPWGGRARDACAFSDCTGYGLGYNLFIWDDMREPDDPRWPSSTDQLRHGMRSPEMESFYAQALQARIARLVAAFEACPERASSPNAARYVPGFLTMLSDVESDVTDGDPLPQPDSELLGLIALWQTDSTASEARAIVRELREFFAFAMRTGTVGGAKAWDERFAEADIEAELCKGFAELAATRAEADR